MHSVLAAGSLEIARRAGMTEPATAEVDADPNEIVLVSHQIDVVIAGTDRAELPNGLLPVCFHVGFAPGVGVVEKLMPNALVVRAADPERDHLAHIGEDVGDLVLDLAETSIEAHGHISTADIETDAGNADLLLVSDDAANGLGIAEVPVRADDASDAIAD